MFLDSRSFFSQLMKWSWLNPHILNWAQFCKEMPALFLKKRWGTCSISFDWIFVSAPYCLKKLFPSIGLFFSQNPNMRQEIKSFPKILNTCQEFKLIMFLLPWKEKDNQKFQIMVLVDWIIPIELKKLQIYVIFLFESQFQIRFH